jgi:hypothetical protein
LVPDECGIESSERLGRRRWVIERTMSWLSGYRRLAHRYERNSPRIHRSHPHKPGDSRTAPDSPTITAREPGARLCDGCTYSEQQKRPPEGRAETCAPGRTRTCGQALRRCGQGVEGWSDDLDPPPSRAAGRRCRLASLPSALPSLLSAATSADDLVCPRKTCAYRLIGIS